MGSIIPKPEHEHEPILIPIPIPIPVQKPRYNSVKSEPIYIPTKIRQDTPIYNPKFKIKSRLVVSFP